ncbi:SDR family oxidoreductase [Haloarcula sp. S1CR25-12]|uniref:SDR family oxidoreductase n=1 Tax=Haloarcula saliterrae TaxID=2950534 RepID=A0ABU2F7K4_9EURY|nr:SDR family oxidoreductase [Haloarcula sp. S1CR25-12]MDS0258172.1 SDR family oxidoreductase [Haloarcula sp. S1CR25-12]
MSQLLDGQTTVVTGGASGLGRAISLRFAEHGANVVVADIREDPKEGGEPTHERIAAETDQRAEYVECSVTDYTDLEVAAEAAEELGGLDIWVNNAGVISHIDFLEVTPEDFDHVMDIDLKGVFFGAQAAAKQFLDQETAGTIINMASLAAARTGGDMPLYGPAKAGVQQLTFSLADRFGDEGIRVNCINPGWTETQMLAESPMGEGEEGQRFQEMLLGAIPQGRFGRPEEVANVALFLASDLASYVNGERILVDGGFAHT